MGSTSDSWRAIKARNRLYFKAHRIEYYQKMSAVQTSIANMADFLEEPYAQHLYHINMIDIQGTKVYDYHM